MTWLIPKPLRASLSSPGSPGSNSEWISLSEAACAFWVTASGTPSLRPSSWKGWKRRTWSLLLFGRATSQPWILPRLSAWISSQRVPRASRTPSPANEKGKPTTVISGPSSSEPSTPCDPPWSSSKTSQVCLPGFDLSERNYADWVTGLRDASSRRRTSARRTVESDSSCWPTANTRDAASSGRHSTETGVMHPGTTLTDAIREWPTPSAVRYGSNKGGSDAEAPEGWSRNGKERPSLDTLAK